MADMETAKKFFDKCDADGSGKIRKCEVYNVLKQFKSHDEAIQFMAEVFKFDKDADGEISWEEFKTAIQHSG
ncbi:hypothetical protein LSH36_880g00044 [Paralvinella palmiformis]|uniref:EF-hand domain-containing protein n=1 Tax=Paralvinella palmiformis TaxID=53620 RepID=A0AAD9IYJ7_9ANNE|nr:hypothetical protein LSH36_880g00044 [Paralvinella palmiformis]